LHTGAAHFEPIHLAGVTVTQPSVLEHAGAECGARSSVVLQALS